MRVFINRVIVSGYLTRDPQLLRLESGSVCKIRIGCHSRRRDGESGRWRQKPNFFDVTVFGEEGEAVARRAGKGAAIAVDGRLDWREWRRRDGSRTQGVSIIADTVHLMDAPPAGGADRAGRRMGSPGADDPVPAGDTAPRGAGRTGSPAADDWLELSPQPAALDGGELDFALFAADACADARIGANATGDADAVAGAAREVNTGGSEESPDDPTGDAGTAAGRA